MVRPLACGAFLICLAAQFPQAQSIDMQQARAYDDFRWGVRAFQRNPLRGRRPLPGEVPEPQAGRGAPAGVAGQRAVQGRLRGGGPERVAAGPRARPGQLAAARPHPAHRAAPGPGPRAGAPPPIRRGGGDRGGAGQVPPAEKTLGRPRPPGRLLLRGGLRVQPDRRSGREQRCSAGPERRPEGVRPALRLPGAARPAHRRALPVDHRIRRQPPAQGQPAGRPPARVRQPGSGPRSLPGTRSTWPQTPAATST